MKYLKLFLRKQSIFNLYLVFICPLLIIGGFITTFLANDNTPTLIYRLFFWTFMGIDCYLNCVKILVAFTSYDEEAADQD